MRKANGECEWRVLPNLHANSTCSPRTPSSSYVARSRTAAAIVHEPSPSMAITSCTFIFFAPPRINSTPYKRLRTGVCSSWLASLEPGVHVPLCIRPGTFKLPQSPFHPLVMVGPGTGVAPMRSVILERRQQRNNDRRQAGQVSIGEEGASPEGGGGAKGGCRVPDTLFFGCRCRGGL